MIRRADQRKFALIGNGENNPLIVVLQHVGAVMLIEPRHHDVRPLHQPHLGLRRTTHDIAEHLPHPRPSCVDQHFRLDGLLTLRALDIDMPQRAHAPRASNTRPRQDRRTPVGCIARIQHHQPRVIDSAIRILKAARREARL